MEAVARKKEAKVVKTKKTVKSGSINSLEHNLQNGKDVRESSTSDKNSREKQWAIASITKTDLVSGDIPLNMNGINEKDYVIEDRSHHSRVVEHISETKKWEIESIHSIEDVDEIDLMTTQVQEIPIVEEKKSSIKNGKEILTNGKYEIQSVIELKEPPKNQIVEQEWDISSIKSNLEKPPSKNGSVILEDSWVEYHDIPMHSTSVQMRTNQQTNQPLTYTITPVSKGQSSERSIFVANPEIKYPNSTSRSEIIIGSRLDEFGRNVKEKSKPVDHYNYQYQDATKTLKLRQLANSINTNNTNVYSSFEKPSQFSTTSNINTHAKQWPTTNCMKQSIHVDNDDEEILGIPLIFDENNKQITNIKDTQSFNSITENVSFQIHNNSAQMKIEISVEMFHNTDKVRQMWKRKKVKVTRLVELDLSKVGDKLKLQEIIDRCNVRKPQLGWTDNRGVYQETEKKLTGKDAYMVFYNLMAITHEEEGEAERRENLYLTRTPNGQLTSVICEPQFLLTGVKDRANSTLFY